MSIAVPEFIYKSKTYFTLKKKRKKNQHPVHSNLKPQAKELPRLLAKKGGDFFKWLGIELEHQNS